MLQIRGVESGRWRRPPVSGFHSVVQSDIASRRDWRDERLLKRFDGMTGFERYRDAPRKRQAARQVNDRFQVDETDPIFPVSTTETLNGQLQSRADGEVLPPATVKSA